MPDILTTAKGITGAYVPLGLTATTDEIADYFDDHYFAHGHTYEAHPLTLAPAMAAIREYKRLGLIERSRTMGEKLGAEAARRSRRSTRRSATCAAAACSGRSTWSRIAQKKTPFNTQDEKLAGKPLVVDQVTTKMMSLGVSCLGWISHLVIAPPLIITEAELDEGLRALDEALALADAAIAA